MPDAPRVPFQIMTKSGPIVEFPMTTFRLAAGPNMPVGGGGYLRMLPTWYTRLGVARAVKEGLPVICYIHPWELDPEQPRIKARLRSRLRHYTNLDKTAARLRQLMGLARFTNFRESGLVDVHELQTVKL
jgi:hypothetical protein